jgi:CheY-like chemotaxis protein
VLVVEDDDAIRDGLVELLSEHGYEAVGAVHGLDALNEAMRMHQAGTPPRLILLDVMMPVMDGPSFRKQQLRIPELAKIPVVLISAYDDVVRHALTLRAAAYFSKPIDDWGLLHVMAQVGSAHP